MSVTQPKYNPLGDLIRALLAARGLKAFELAEKVGISKQPSLKSAKYWSAPQRKGAPWCKPTSSKALKKDRAAPLNPAMEANAHIQGLAKDH